MLVYCPFKISNHGCNFFWHFVEVDREIFFVEILSHLVIFLPPNQPRLLAQSQKSNVWNLFKVSNNETIVSFLILYFVLVFPLFYLNKLMPEGIYNHFRPE